MLWSTPRADVACDYRTSAAMLYLDVTQSCRSANNSGVQVVTRNLYRALAAKAQVQPLAWDPLLQCYAKLSLSERDRLENPFPRDYKPTARPNKRDNPAWKTFSRSILRLSRRMKWRGFAEAGTTMIFPEVFRDARAKVLPLRLPGHLTKAAVFYDTYVLKEPEKTPPKRARNFIEYAKFVASSNLILCISRETKEDLERFILPEVKDHGHATVAYLPVERPANLPSNPNTETSPLILCVSTLGYQKNHLGLLEAAERLWKDGLDFRLELIGKADPTWTGKILPRIDELRDEGKDLHWLRHVDDQKLAERYRHASFTVYPSRYEGFGLPILESMAHGKPCVCGSNGALGEASSEGGCLQVDQNDPASLAGGIRKLLEKGELLQSLQEEALGRDLGSWDDYADSFLKNLSQVDSSD